MSRKTWSKATTDKNTTATNAAGLIGISPFLPLLLGLHIIHIPLQEGLEAGESLTGHCLPGSIPQSRSTLRTSSW